MCAAVSLAYEGVCSFFDVEEATAAADAESLEGSLEADERSGGEEPPASNEVDVEDVCIAVALQLLPGVDDLCGPLALEALAAAAAAAAAACTCFCCRKRLVYVEAGERVAAAAKPWECVWADWARGRCLEAAEVEALSAVATGVLVLQARGVAGVVPTEDKSSNGGVAGRKASFRVSGDDAGEAAFAAT